MSQIIDVSELNLGLDDVITIRGTTAGLYGAKAAKTTLKRGTGAVTALFYFAKSR